MLEELLGNTTRSAVLRLFWDEGFQGSVVEAQAELQAGYGGVHRELVRLGAAGMLTKRREGRKLVFAANSKYPHAKTLRAVLDAAPVFGDARQPKLYRELVARGAPLLATSHARPRPAERLFVEAVEVSRRDATLLRALPAWLDGVLERGEFNLSDAVQLASRSAESHAAGFVLALTAAATRRSSLANEAEHLRDLRRVADERYLLAGRRSKQWCMRVAKARPKVAKDWHYLLDIPVSDFAAFARKHQGAA